MSPGLLLLDGGLATLGGGLFVDTAGVECCCEPSPDCPSMPPFYLTCPLTLNVVVNFVTPASAPGCIGNPHAGSFAVVRSSFNSLFWQATNPIPGTTLVQIVCQVLQGTTFWSMGFTFGAAQIARLVRPFDGICCSGAYVPYSGNIGTLCTSCPGVCTGGGTVSL